MDLTINRNGRAQIIGGVVRAVLLLAVGAIFMAGSAFGAVVKLPNKTCRHLAKVNAAISLIPADGVTSMDFTVTYNPAVLTARKAYRTRFTTSYSLTYNVATPGTVTLHLAGAPALSGNADVVWIAFDAIGFAGASSPLTLTASSLNGGAIPSTAQNGVVAVVNPQTLISAPAVVSEPGATIPVMISAGPFTGGDSFDIDLAFDPGVVNATNVEKTPLTQPLNLVSNFSTPGLVRIAIYGTQSINGPGDLVKVTFHAVGPLGSETPIDVTRGNINEAAIPTTLDSGLYTVCHTADADGDGYSGCTGDCNDGNPNVHPNTPELCNGVDDNCDGTIDNAPPLMAGVTAVKQLVNTRLNWTALTGASSYDVLRGSLGTLRSSSGNFTSATQACVANNLAATTVTDGTVVIAGNGLWYLLRGVNCIGSGTYDEGGTQIGLRDAEIQAAASHCP